MRASVFADFELVLIDPVSQCVMAVSVADDQDSTTVHPHPAKWVCEDRPRAEPSEGMRSSFSSLLFLIPKPMWASFARILRVGRFMGQRHTVNLGVPKGARA
jgi:hypothetical protein